MNHTNEDGFTIQAVKPDTELENALHVALGAKRPLADCDPLEFRHNHFFDSPILDRPPSMRKSRDVESVLAILDELERGNG